MALAQDGTAESNCDINVAGGVIVTGCRVLCLLQTTNYAPVAMPMTLMTCLAASVTLRLVTLHLTFNRDIRY